jgi:F-type H+-transporting ATPase subunit gamma
MAQGRIYRKKIKSAKNIAKITRAMQMVSASKMKKAQEGAEAGRPYAQGLLSIAGLISSYLDPSFHPLLSYSEGNELGELIILIAPEKGLCGSLITNLIKRYAASQNKNVKTEYIVIGKKAKYVASKFSGDIIAEFSMGVSQPSYELVPAITRVVTEKFLSGAIGKVSVYYSEFINTMSQVPNFKVLLPLKLSTASTDTSEESKKAAQSYCIFEPNPSEITEALLGRYLETELYHYLLEAYASEQSARMVAMKNATDNAEGLIYDLTVKYNKARQAGITSEIADIASASMMTEA